ncbi:hypothetical protein RJ640_017205 [Escallonia rubra]|uniref:Uncharacterized protein n=1 Tax=Escallonia rubra TaxID=112253 RepID=A0AA88UMM4_9ASTE|nr:hypothetical protein RJ640_017205 [Escallonia rubra]
MEGKVRKKFIQSTREKLPLYSVGGRPEVCMYKVPEKLRKINEEAYTPRIVSIGPTHRGNSPQLQAAERYKWRCLDRYLGRIKYNFTRLAMMVGELENNVRACYPDSFDNIKREEFLEMIMLDGAFMFELFQENWETNPIDRDTDPTNRDKPIFDNTLMKRDILHDMMLLENQLPISVPLHFWLLTEPRVANFSDIILKYFEEVTLSALPEQPKGGHIRHLVEYLLNIHRPLTSRAPAAKVTLATRSATELQNEAGVTFKEGTGKCLFDIHFSKGELTIPQLTVNEHTETFFRNLIAFEQCERDKVTKDITSYCILMDNLVNTEKDVELLIHYDIIKNSLPDDEQVLKLLNNLRKEATTDKNTFYFAKLFEELDDYSRDYWYQWKANWLQWKRMLRRDYFSNPWSSISVIAAVILLILTVLQTIEEKHRLDNKQPNSKVAKVNLMENVKESDTPSHFNPKDNGFINGHNNHNHHNNGRNRNHSHGGRRQSNLFRNHNNNADNNGKGKKVLKPCFVYGRMNHKTKGCFYRKTDEQKSKRSNKNARNTSGGSVRLANNIAAQVPGV